MLTAYFLTTDNKLTSTHRNSIVSIDKTIYRYETLLFYDILLNRRPTKFYLYAKSRIFRVASGLIWHFCPLRISAICPSSASKKYFSPQNIFDEEHCSKPYIYENFMGRTFSHQIMRIRLFFMTELLAIRFAYKQWRFRHDLCLERFSLAMFRGDFYFRFVSKMGFNRNFSQ